MSQDDRPAARSLALFAAACLAGAELGLLTIERTAPTSLPAFWPPVGVLVAALVTREPRRWMPFLATACAAMVLSMAGLHGRGLLPSVAAAALCGLDASAVAWLVRRSTGDAFAIDRIQHTSRLVVAAVIAPVAGALLGRVLLEPAVSPASPVLLRWWLGETIGVIVTTQLVLAVSMYRPASLPRLRSWKALEVAVVLVAGILIAEWIFSQRVDPALRVPAYLLPFLLWPVFRFGPSGGPAAAFILSFVALWYASAGQGPLSMFGTENLILRAQVAIVIAGASLLLMAGMVAERNRVAQERAALVAELQRALAELKTLRGFIPICAWCHKVRDDAGFWQQLEMYLNARTDATFSHSICPTCTEREHKAIEAHELSAEAM